MATSSVAGRELADVGLADAISDAATEGHRGEALAASGVPPKSGAAASGVPPKSEARLSGVLVEVRGIRGFHPSRGLVEVSTESKACDCAEPAAIEGSVHQIWTFFDFSCRNGLVCRLDPIMRPLRHVPPGGAWFEITTRTLQSRYLIPHGERFRSIAVAIFARAKERFPVEIYAYGGLANHLHVLIGVRDVDTLAGFMGYVNSNLAREANRITGWSEKLWGRRYRAIPISDEEAALIGRLRYILSHGVKENLVPRCRDWPGLQCVDALTQGRPLQGTWRNRSLAYEAARSGREVDPEKVDTQYELELDPLPCWRDLSKEEIAKRIREIVQAIDSEAAQRIEEGGKPPLGLDVILKQNPWDSPNSPKKSPAPTVHAASKPIREKMKAAYRLFEEAYRRAAERLRLGELTVAFPAGCFPPPRPFIPAGGIPPDGDGLVALSV